jgi:hypothetical protein
MKLAYVQDSNGVWHIRDLHPMGLVKIEGKEQIGFPSTGTVCPQCRATRTALDTFTAAKIAQAKGE